MALAAAADAGRLVSLLALAEDPKTLLALPGRTKTP